MTYHRRQVIGLAGGGVALAAATGCAETELARESFSPGGGVSQTPSRPGGRCGGSMTQAKDRPDVQVFTEIGIIDQLVTARLERSLPAGLSTSQFRVLTHFCRRGGVETPLQLARAFQVTKGAMTNTLQRLEAHGFIRIEGDATDGRRKLVTLTPEGAAAYERAIATLRPYYVGLREAFTDAEFEAAIPFLKALRIWLDENR